MNSHTDHSKGLMGLLAILIALTLNIAPACRDGRQPGDPQRNSNSTQPNSTSNAQAHPSRESEASSQSQNSGVNSQPGNTSPKGKKEQEPHGKSNSEALQKDSGSPKNEINKLKGTARSTASSESGYPAGPLLLSIVALLLAGGWWAHYITQTLKAKKLAYNGPEVHHESSADINIKKLEDTIKRLTLDLEKANNSIKRIEERMESSAVCMNEEKEKKSEQRLEESVRGYFTEVRANGNKAYFESLVYSKEERRVNFKAKIFNGERAEFEPLDNIDQLKSSDAMTGAVVLAGKDRQQAERMETTKMGEAKKEADNRWVIIKKAEVRLS